MKRREFRTPEVTALTGVSSALLGQWVRAGLVKLCRRGSATGRGRQVFFGERDVFVASMIRALTRRGMTLSYIEPITRFLNGLTIDEIEEAAKECKVLAAAGRALRPCFVDLDSEALGEAAGKAMKSGTNELMLTFPMAVAWESYRAGIDHFDKHLAAPLN
jgi:DNA-binding transcriptional MerR regulator